MLRCYCWTSPNRERCDFIKNGHKVKKSKFTLAWIVVIIWAAVIFYLSSQPADASDKLSKGVTEAIVRAVGLIYPLHMDANSIENWIDQLNGVVRQYAHATVFLILAVFVLNALRGSGLAGLKAFLTAFAFCAAYAFSDETHQIFVPGRAWELSDLARDCLGTLTGLVLYSLVVSVASVKGRRKLR